ncbi:MULTISPECIES: GNAT family N-acetyltransferase [unclassified Xanthobacter]|uniref:GNAT family N-acetyltransferase n=1 Tax=unclassified Xanthobacter TaxID=2623496 RepID=UPI001EDFC194|nr:MULTISPECIES: GNAT family protein [unclassified Xanthobacter]
MWLLSTLFAPDVLPSIEGDRVYLRVPQTGDFPAWRDLRAQSRAFLTPWEPLWPSDDLSRGAFRRRLRRYARDMLADEAYPLLVFRQGDHQLLGGLTLSNVRRGVCQAASLGYWMGAPYAGQGYMKAAVTALLPVAHEVLHLHRVEAACMPNNRPSIALLEGCGFTREGYSREYLCINGVWEDHLMFARLRHDALRPGTRPRESSAAQ